MEYDRGGGDLGRKNEHGAWAYQGWARHKPGGKLGSQEYMAHHEGVVMRESECRATLQRKSSCVQRTVGALRLCQAEAGGSLVVMSLLLGLRHLSVCKTEG